MRLELPVNINIRIHHANSVNSADGKPDTVNIGSPFETPTSKTKSVTNNLEVTALNIRNYRNTHTGVLLPRIQPRKWSNVARFMIQLHSNRYFTELPTLIVPREHEDNIKIVLSKKTYPEEYVDKNKKVNAKRYIIKCSYNVMFRSVRSISSTNPLNCSVKYKTSSYLPIVEAKPLIRNIDFGNKLISPKGENREIKIYGDPGAEFGLAINESFEESSVDNSGGGVAYEDDYGHHGDLKYINKFNDISLLNKGAGKGFLKYFITGGIYGSEIRIVRGRVDKTGVATLRQTFPSNTINKSTNIAAVSNSAYVTLNNNFNLKKGDRIHASGIDSNTVVKVLEAKTDEDSSGQVDNGKVKLDTNVTLAKGVNIGFTRDRIYSIDVVPDYTETTNTNLVDRGSGAINRVDQNDSKILTWRIGGNNGWTITSNNGITAGMPIRNNPLDVKVNMVPGSTSVVKTSFNLLIDLHTGTHNFRSITKPRVNQRSSRNDFGTSANNYTESLFKNTSGLKFTCTNFSYSALRGHTASIIFDLNVTEGGTKDIIIPLDLDKTLKYSTNTP